MNSSQPDMIGLDDEWQRLLSGTAEDNDATNLSQLNPLELDFPTDFGHFLEVNSSSDVVERPQGRLLNFCTLSPPTFGVEFPAHVSQNVETAPHTEPEIVDSKRKPIGDDISSVVERLNQE